MRIDDTRIGIKARFRFDWKFLLAATFLLLVWWELHELVHILAGWGMCGGFGSRDFNSWGLADGCTRLTPTFLGPVFTIVSGWVAIGLMFSRRVNWRAFGVGLFWAANPASRLLTVMIFGGGDEAFGLKRLMEAGGMEDGYELSNQIATIILALAIIPQLIVFAYKVRPRWWLWLPVFLILPLATAMAVLLGIYGPLHATGWLSQPGLFGGSVMINLVGLFNLVVSLLTIRWLFRVPD